MASRPNSQPLNKRNRGEGYKLDELHTTPNTEGSGTIYDRLFFESLSGDSRASIQKSVSTADNGAYVDTYGKGQVPNMDEISKILIGQTYIGAGTFTISGSISTGVVMTDCWTGQFNYLNGLGTASVNGAVYIAPISGLTTVYEWTLNGTVVLTGTNPIITDMRAGIRQVAADLTTVTYTFVGTNRINNAGAAGTSHTILPFYSHYILTYLPGTTAYIQPTIALVTSGTNLTATLQTAYFQVKQVTFPTAYLR
jgi:hypothetical protein